MFKSKSREVYKRKKSDDSFDNGYDGKARRCRGSSGEVNVSDILSQTNNVLYNEDDGFLELTRVLHESVCEDSEGEEAEQDKLITKTSMASGGCVSPGPGPSNVDIMKCRTRIEGKISHMETRLKSLDIVEKKVSGFDSELKKRWTYIMDTSKKSEQRISKIEEKAETIDFSVGLTNDMVVEIERDNNRLRDEVVYLQSQSMRNNLTFSNIFKTNTDGTEDTEQVLRTFL